MTKCNQRFIFIKRFAVINGVSIVIIQKGTKNRTTAWKERSLLQNSKQQRGEMPKDKDMEVKARQIG